MFYLFKTPHFVFRIFPNYLWKKSRDQKVIYLTFDDGPTPEVTEWVLDMLEKYNAKATFFCIGKNVVANPEICASIMAQHHTIGNHTYSHLNGWKTNFKTYIEDIKKAGAILNKTQKEGSALFFRPAYGKITRKQSKYLRKLGYKIVMWDILSGDFDVNLSPEKSLQKVIKHTSSGSIVVFHDSNKAKKTLQYVLPKALEYWKNKGYKFLAIQ